MINSTKNLALEFMQTEQGQYSKYKFCAILGLKYNHQNPFSHNFLVYFQNIKTGYPETIEVSPELLRYKFKLGYVYQKAKEVSKLRNEEIDYLRIDTQKLKQKPLFTVLKKETVQNEIINIQEQFKTKFKNFAFQYGGNNCYEHFENGNRYIIPSSVINLYYYIRSSSMKDALFRGNIESLYNDKESDLNNKEDAKLVLKPKSAKLDGAFTYRFITDKTANKSFSDLFRYISSYKSKLDAKKEIVNLIPIKSLFPTKEVFTIKVRYEKLETENNTYLVHQILNDDSTLDFEKLTVLKTIRKEQLISPSIDSFPIKGRKPKEIKPIVKTNTPYANYGTSIIKATENGQNMSLKDKELIYGNIEDTSHTKVPFETDIEVISGANVSFSTDNNGGDKTSKSHKLEQKEDKENAHKPPNFEIFKQSIEILENSGYVSDFIFLEEYFEVPEGLNKNGTRTQFCSIDGKLKRYIFCFLSYNDINIVLVEVESENSDFATWVLSSRNDISDGQIYEVLEHRFKLHEKIRDIENSFNDISSLKFKTHRHAQINDKNIEEHEEILQRWVIRLLNQVKV
jgi:hypothetical protein